MNLQSYKQLLSEFVRFQSISTDPNFLPAIEDTVEWLQNLFENYGFETKIFPGEKTNPVIFAHYKNPKATQTVLIYGHYDVQPAQHDEGWDADPFTLTEKEGKYIARGVVDNKGQILIHIFTVLNLIKEKKLQYNVKFLIEGNEETSNPELSGIMKKNSKLLASDYVLVSDGELVDGKPAIEASLRGGFNLTLQYKTADNNVHSGIYGGAVPNAAYELTKLLDKLFDKNNSVTVEHFYDNVDEITEEHKKHTERIAHTSQKLIKHAGMQAHLHEAGHNFYTQTGLRPTLQITGLKSGYIGNGYANIIPATAEARINFRLVASQKPDEVILAFRNFVKKYTPEYVDFTLTTDGIHNPVKIDINAPIIQTMKKQLHEAYKDQPVIKYVGGAIPFVGDIKDIFGINTILVPLANDDCNMHGANENFSVDLIQKALHFSELFFST